MNEYDIWNGLAGASIPVFLLGFGIVVFAGWLLEKQNQRRKAEADRQRAERGEKPVKWSDLAD